MGFKDSLKSVVLVLSIPIVGLLVSYCILKDPIPWWDSRILWNMCDLKNPKNPMT